MTATNEATRLNPGLPRDLRDAVLAAMDAGDCSQAQLAAAVGCSPSMLSRICDGSRMPNRAVARGIVRELTLVPGAGASLILLADAHAKTRNLARRHAPLDRESK
jgi:transcriptional regulator with XRE-family HTH domain